MSIIKKYKAKVEQVSNPLPDIFTVTFSSTKKFVYRPGQFLHLALDEYDGVGQWPESRCFSMQSDPSSPEIKITFSEKGNFTKKMSNELKPGREVWLKLPYGEMFDKNYNKDHCVFIAGGTGVTPFLSLFTSILFGEYRNPRLYLGLRSEKYNIYSEELSIAKDINKSFEFKATYQDIDGMLNIKKIVNITNNSTYFISGPPVMIKEFKKYLKNTGIDNHKIITDEWE